MLEFCYLINSLFLGHPVASDLQDEATYRAIKLAELVNVPLYVVHVMSSVAAAFVREARAAGQRVIGEAVASGFASSEAAVFHPDFQVCTGNACAHCSLWQLSLS